MLINSQQPILIVGGAGYIGSHMVLTLAQAGFHPIVLDNLSKGHRDAVLAGDFILGDAGDKNLLQQLFAKYQFSAVMHFASFIEVAESVQQPEKYYQNNVAATLNLLDVMLQNHVPHFIFSSTAAVYGEPQYTPIDEKHSIAPLNPYGRSKSMVEMILSDYAKSHGLRPAILRYFNAAGADPQGRLGERHQPESHLIPLLLQVAAGEREHLTVNGQDYPTADGTCIRDYVHVTDLCTAHLLALQALLDGEPILVCNLGTGRGYSVREVITAAQQVTKKSIPILNGPRRSGDPAILVADATLAKRILGWQPKYDDLSSIVSHAWQFIHKRAAA